MVVQGGLFFSMVSVKLLQSDCVFLWKSSPVLLMSGLLLPRAPAMDSVSHDVAVAPLLIVDVTDLQ